jgi:hypothetical protein
VPFAPDLVAMINIENIENKLVMQKNIDVDVLTDLVPGPPKTVWPNEVKVLPEGMLPFKALLVPQGFHVSHVPGRLAILNLDDPSHKEYIVSQSTETGSYTGPFDTKNDPAFYSDAVFWDMDGDGFLDIVTVRSGFRVGATFHPPSGELVWFRNPGKELKASTEWNETVLFGGPPNFAGPDISIDMYDFEGDGIPEFVTSHFFAGTNVTDPDDGKFTIYGAPLGYDWSVVNARNAKGPPQGPQVRIKDIVTDQGKPFGFELVDLDGDGRIDILATNHQPDGTDAWPSMIPGRILAFEQPNSGKIFTDEWVTHILMDDIRPYPSFPGQIIGRLGPGAATTIHANDDRIPKIFAGGDEAGKVWLLTREKNWNYDVEEIFDINVYYGPGTTQTILEDPAGVTISTIGEVSVTPSSKKPGAFLVFVPVFEAREIHVLRVSTCK